MKKYNLIIALKNTQQMEQILNKLNPYEMCQEIFIGYNCIYRFWNDHILW